MEGISFLLQQGQRSRSVHPDGHMNAVRSCIILERFVEVDIGAGAIYSFHTMLRGHSSIDLMDASF